MGKYLKTDGSETNVTPRNGKYFTLKEMQEYVGGLIQLIFLHKDEEYDVMILNEEGKCFPLAANAKATTLLIRAGGLPHDIVTGNALLVKNHELQ